MKKQSIILIFSLMINNLGFCQSQDYVKISFLGYDNDIIKSALDSLIAKGLNEVIVLHTDRLLAPIDSIEKEDSVFSVIIWHDEKDSYLRIISSDKIYKVKKVSDLSVFQYPHKQLTGVRSSELKDLIFFPPGTGPNALIYYNKGIEFYFEKMYNKRDSPYIYNPDNKYERYRNEWFDKVSRFLINNSVDRQFESNYDRYKN